VGESARRSPLAGPLAQPLLSAYPVCWWRRWSSTSFRMNFGDALAVLQSRASTAAPLGTTASTAATTLLCSTCDTCEPDSELPASPAQVELTSLDVVALLHRFLQRQEERVAAYRKFEEGFLLFLQVAEAEPASYEALVKYTTASFAAISDSINNIEAELRSRTSATASLAEVLRKVQLLEREKLQLTAQLQIVRHGLALDALQAEATEDANSKEARMAALRAEEGADLGRRLTSVTGQLNEALDEVRCEMSEMADEDGDEDK